MYLIKPYRPYQTLPFGVFFKTAVIFLLITACSFEPDPIHFGQDECAYCRMIVSEKPFGSQLVTSKGKTYKFDSIECLAAMEIRPQAQGTEIHSRWVPLLSNPDKRIDALVAVFVYSESIRSPMGLSLSAHPSRNAALAILDGKEGRLMNWDEVLEFVKDRWRL